MADTGKTPALAVGEVLGMHPDAALWEEFPCPLFSTLPDQGL